jgi:hypothetical protein
MRILLLNPFGRESDTASKKLPSKYIEEPLGLMYIYSYMKHHAPEHEITILDASLLLERSQENSMAPLWNRLSEKIRSYSPDMVGTVFYLQTIRSICKILKIPVAFNPSQTHGQPDACQI